MLKRILGNKGDDPSLLSGQWLGIDAIAGTSVTSEANEAPVESVLDPDNETEWRAGNSGVQVIRIAFGQPKTIRRIQLEFQGGPVRKNSGVHPPFDGRGR